MNLTIKVLALISLFIGFVSLTAGLFCINLHKVYVEKAKSKKKRAGKAYIKIGATFFSLGLSEVVFSFAYSLQAAVLGWAGLFTTVITIFIGIYTSCDLKKYPE